MAKMNVTEKDFEAFLQATESLMAIYQEISYYADPLAKKPKNKEIDPELEKTFDKLGIPLEERLALSGIAVDAIMDSVSVKTTFKEKLREKGVIFCSIGEAVKEHPDLVREYLGTVVPYRFLRLKSCKTFPIASSFARRRISSSS